MRDTAKDTEDFERYFAFLETLPADATEHADARGTIALDQLLVRVGGKLDALVTRVQKVNGPAFKDGARVAHSRAWNLDARIVWEGWWRAGANGPEWHEEWIGGAP